MPRRAGILDAVTARFRPAVWLSAVLLLPAVAVIAQAATVSAAETASSGLGLTVMSRALLEGIPTGPDAGLLHVHGDLRASDGADGDSGAVYQALFRVDTGATDSIAPASELEHMGIVPVGTATYERADGTVEDYPYGLVRIEFMGEMKEGRVLFGPEDVEPALGVSALESIGLTVDPATRTIERTGQ